MSQCQHRELRAGYVSASGTLLAWYCRLCGICLEYCE
jgi:hypothetical protein